MQQLWARVAFSTLQRYKVDNSYIETQDIQSPKRLFEARAITDTYESSFRLSIHEEWFTDILSDRKRRNDDNDDIYYVEPYANHPKRHEGLGWLD
jgi:hypothetical protein